MTAPNYRRVKENGNSCAFCQYFTENTVSTLNKITDSCSKHNEIIWIMPKEGFILDISELENNAGRWICDDFKYKHYIFLDDDNDKEVPQPSM